MRNSYTLIFIFLMTSCSMMNSFNGPSALATNDFIQALELLRKNRKEDALLKFENSCEAHVLAACLYLGNDIDHKKLRPFSIMQGMTGNKEALLSILFTTSKNNIIEIYDETSGKLVSSSNIIFEQQQWPSFKARILTIKLSNLIDKHNYRLEIYNGDYRLNDVRWFSTLNPNPKDFNYVVASCMDDKFNDIQKNMWKGVYALKPEALFLIGDNAYLDTKLDRSKKITAAHMWSRFIDHRKTLELYYYKKLIPVFGLWDDHDYGSNNGNKNFELKAEATKIFQSFFPFYNIKEAQAGHGVGYKLSLANSNFYFLDARSFRDIRDAKTKKNGTHFGMAQEKWLYLHLNRDKRHSFLIKGDQFFGGYHSYESYESHHPKSFKTFLNKVGRAKAPVFFISGDRHLTEIMELTKADFKYKTYEHTSSGIHSSVYPGSFIESPNKRMMVGNDGVHNFSYIKSELTRKKLLLNITSFGYDRIVHYSKRLEFKK